MGAQDNPSFADKLRGFFSTDSHQRIERFGHMVIALGMSLLLIMTIMTNSVMQHGKAVFTSTTLFTPAATSSLTQQTVEVKNVYRNSAGTRVLVLMKVPSSGPLSLNADGYQAFLRGVDSNSLKTYKALPVPFSGGMFMFGNTGYLGLMLDSPQKIPDTMMQIIMRSTSQTSAERERVAASKGVQGMDRLDTWDIFINPGGSSAVQLTALDTQKVNPDEVFYELFIKEKEAAVKKRMDSLLLNIKLNQQKFADLQRSFTCTAGISDCSPVTSLDGLTLMPPVVPAELSTDKVVGSPAVPGKNGKPGKPSTLMLQTTTIMPGGFGFDWHATNAVEGYLAKAVPAGESYTTFMDKLSTIPRERFTDKIAWKLSNGSYLQDYTSKGSTSIESMKPLTELANKVQTLFSDTWQLKYEYEVTSYQDLFKLEIMLRSATQNVTVASGSKVVKVVTQ